MTFPSFDAKIDILGCDLPPGMAPGTAVAAVREAVLAIPGAAWISILYCGHAPHADHARQPEQIRVAFVQADSSLDAAALKALTATLRTAMASAIKSATEAQNGLTGALSSAPPSQPQHREAS